MEFLPLIIIMVIMWAVLILPQQRRSKAHRELLASLDVGDEVLTSSGIYGTVTEFDGQTLFLAVSDNLEIKVTRESIAEKIVYADATDTVED